MENSYDIIAVGGGPAGLTAALYARRSGCSVLVLEKDGFGGQIAASPRVDNYPGLGGISGAELAERMYNQAEEAGAVLELDQVLEIQDGPVKTVICESGSYTCRAVILATGMHHRTLGLPEEAWMDGISYCAVCDGAFYADRDVAVCGGGNTAFQDALLLSSLCRHVTLIHRRDSFRAEPVLVQALQNQPNVTICTNTVITGMTGADNTLQALQLKDVQTGKISTLDVDGLFEAVGQLPQTALAQALGLTDSEGFIRAGEDCRTTCGGIFTAGDCRSKQIRQLTTACADGAIAALAACALCQT